MGTRGRQRNEDLPRLLRREEVAEILGVSPQHVSNLTRQGIIKGVRLGKSIRYAPDDLVEAIRACKG